MVQEQGYAATSGAATAGSFIASANEYLQFFALCIAIVSGGLALYTHWKRRRDERKRGDSG